MKPVPVIATEFTVTGDVPVDVSVTKMLGIRVEPGFYRTSFNRDHQGNFRLSVGPVFRFGGK